MKKKTKKLDYIPGKKPKYHLRVQNQSKLIIDHRGFLAGNCNDDLTFGTPIIEQLLLNP